MLGPQALNNFNYMKLPYMHEFELSKLYPNFISLDKGQMNTYIKCKGAQLTCNAKRIFVFRSSDGKFTLESDLSFQVQIVS